MTRNEVGGRASAITGRLLAAPHLVRPEWLLEGEPGRRDAVPFATAEPIPAAAAERLAAASRAAGERYLLGCPAAPGREDEPARRIPADAAAIRAAAGDLAAPDILVALPGLSAALLGTSAGFAVAAGPPRFAGEVAGADLERARRDFAGFAFARRHVSAALLDVASYYGCPLSGRPWRPAWLAWRRAADVPAGSGAGRQLAAMRELAGGGTGPQEFTRAFRTARRRQMLAGERADGPLAAALHAVYQAVTCYVPSAGGPHPPGTLDGAALRDAVAAALRDA